MTKSLIGTSVTRQDAQIKVTGGALYTADMTACGALCAKVVAASHARAELAAVDTSRALAVPGVLAVLTGESYAQLTGPAIEDRPLLARGQVRYYGEPIAIVIADSLRAASEGALAIDIDYRPLTALLSVTDAIAPDAALLHSNLSAYKLKSTDIYPDCGTNICDRKRIRKGDIDKAFSDSTVTAEESFIIPPSAHMPMETHAASAKISADSSVFIRTSSQAPFVVRETISGLFGIPESKITVETPFVGGGFGGKTSAFLEPLAYIASAAVGGRETVIINSREDEFSTPGRMGFEASVTLGALSDGRLTAARIEYTIDTGAYAECGPRILKAIAADCTGPYDIPNVWCDCQCVYTNHPPATAFRGFGHLELTFCIERAMDSLAEKLGLDPVLLREINAIRPGAWSPGAVKTDSAVLGNLPACIERAKELIAWSGGTPARIGETILRAKGLCCFWKSPVPPNGAQAGVIITFNPDGSVNVNCGCCEIGPAMKTTAAQIVADRLRLDIGRASVSMSVNTAHTPEYWETAASLATYMVGIAAAKAAEDAKTQIFMQAAAALNRAADELELCGGILRVRNNHSIFAETKMFAKTVIGRGVFTIGGLSSPDRNTGAGRTGPHWTVGAQAVELEFDEREFTYRLLKAVTVMDAGAVINPGMAEAVVRGGMCMGLSLATRESLEYDGGGKLQNSSLRTYKVMHFGQTPEYVTEFLRSTDIAAPYGSRGLGEHGIIAMPAALAGALSRASGVFLNTFPITPEMIRKAGLT